MGLVSGENKFAVLSDIQGMEDALAIWTLKLPEPPGYYSPAAGYKVGRFQQMF